MYKHSNAKSEWNICCLALKRIKINLAAASSTEKKSTGNNNGIGNSAAGKKKLSFTIMHSSHLLSPNEKAKNEQHVPNIVGWSQTAQRHGQWLPKHFRGVIQMKITLSWNFLFSSFSVYNIHTFYSHCYSNSIHAFNVKCRDNSSLKHFLKLLNGTKCELGARAHARTRHFLCVCVSI